MGSSESFGFKKSVTPKDFAAQEGKNINNLGKLFNFPTAVKGLSCDTFFAFLLPHIHTNNLRCSPHLSTLCNLFTRYLSIYYLSLSSFSR